MLNPVPLTVLDALKVVNAPAAAVEPPIAGGEARYVLKPVPLTVLDALSVVNAPAAGVPLPTAPFNGPANPAAVNVVPLNVKLAESILCPAVVA